MFLHDIHIREDGYLAEDVSDYWCCNHSQRCVTIWRSWLFHYVTLYMKLFHEESGNFHLRVLHLLWLFSFYVKTTVASVRGYGCLCSDLSHSERPKFVANGNRLDYICQHTDYTSKPGNLSFLKLCEYSDYFDPYLWVYRIVGRCVNRLVAKQVLCDGLQSSELHNVCALSALFSFKHSLWNSKYFFFCFISFT